jgi:hypothetical protein
MNSQPMIEPTAQLVSRLALIHAGETTLKLRFVQDTIASIDEHTTRADLVANECTSTDYTPGGFAITYTTGGLTASRVAYNFSGALGFVVLTAAPTNTIAGAWIDNGTDALQRVAFETPVPLDAAGKQILCVVYDGYPPGQLGIEVVQP